MSQSSECLATRNFPMGNGQEGYRVLERGTRGTHPRKKQAGYDACIENDKNCLSIVFRDALLTVFMLFYLNSWLLASFVHRLHSSWKVIACWHCGFVQWSW